MNSNRILVIQTAFLGDAILTLPMIQKLKEQNPLSQIDVLCIPETKEIFENSDSVNIVFVIDKKGKHKSVVNLVKFALQLKKNKYSKVYSPHRSIRTAFVVMLLNAQERIGFDTAALNFVYTKTIKYNKNSHEVARNLKLIGASNISEDWKILPKITIPKETEQKIASLLKSIDKKIIAIAPGSVWETKKYPYYKELCEYLLMQDYFLVFIGGKSDSQLCFELQKKLGENVKSFAGELSVLESLALLRKCSLLICNDSAPTHMALAADIPVITIYCSTIPAFGFYPYSVNSKYISYDNLDCKPCGIHGHNKCPINTFDCGYKLLPEEIIKTLIPN